MKLKIGSKVYEQADADALTLRDMVEFKKQTTAAGLPMTVPLLKTWNEQMQKLKPADRESFEHVEEVFAGNLWVAQRLAGDSPSFDQVLDMDLTEVTLLREPSDETPTQARSPRKGGGRASGNPRKRAATKTT